MAIRLRKRSLSTEHETLELRRLSEMVAERSNLEHRRDTLRRSADEGRLAEDSSLRRSADEERLTKELYVVLTSVRDDAFENVNEIIKAKNDKLVALRTTIGDHAAKHQHRKRRTDVYAGELSIGH